MGEPIEFNDLVKELGLKHKTYLGVILNKLERQGLIIKLVRKRNSIIGITEKGFEYMKDI